MLDATIIKVLADGAVLPVLAIGAWVLLIEVPNKQKFAVYSRVLLAGLTAYLIAKLVASVYQPAELRPFEVLGVQAGASYLNNAGFPSDHSLFVWAITLAVAFAAQHRWLVLLCGLFAFLVCLGRVLALVHTPLDVVGGLVIAALGAIWYLEPGAKVLQKSKT